MTLISRYVLAIALSLFGQAVIAETAVFQVNKQRAVAVESRPMERRNFTQGLYISDSELYVSSNLRCACTHGPT
jgi:glutamine cyclotransferase